MSRFEQHFRLSEADAIEYAREKLNIFTSDARLQCKEIGDGNINYIFRVWEEATGKSVVIKHADVGIRSNPNRLLSTDRNRIESEVMELQNELAPGLVPKVYHYDGVMSCLVMEDISDHKNLRYELIDHQMFPRLADDITTFMVNTLVLTSDAVLDPARKKEMVKRYINIDLCKITEDLVYTDPYTNHSGRNLVIEPNQEYVEKTLYSDIRLHREVAKLKYAFMSNAQALIHGDLHSGSIFVNAGSTKVIDSEFAFFGPMGYDVGNVIGNLLFAWANAVLTMEDPVKKAEYLAWLEKTVVDVIELFKIKFLQLFRESVTERMARTEGYDEWFLATVLADTAGVAGLEMHRRTVGSAKVRDITGITDLARRAKMERIIITAGKEFILNREKYMDGARYIQTIKQAADEVQGNRKPV